VHFDRTINVTQSKFGSNFQAQLPSPHPVYMIEQSGGPQCEMLHAEPLRFLSSWVSLLDKCCEVVPDRDRESYRNK
jgi:hypothetical protein